MAVNDSLREELAALAHAQWSGWMEYLFSKCGGNQHDGTVVIPVWAVERWRRQMTTPYAELPEQEKDSDRAEADRVLEVLNTARIRQSLDATPAVDHDGRFGEGDHDDD